MGAKNVNCIHVFKIIDGKITEFKCRKLKDKNLKLYTCLEVVGRDCPMKKPPTIEYLPFAIEYNGIIGIYYKNVFEEEVNNVDNI